MRIYLCITIQNLSQRMQPPPSSSIAKNNHLFPQFLVNPSTFRKNFQAESRRPPRDQRSRSNMVRCGG